MPRSTLTLNLSPQALKHLKDLSARLGFNATTTIAVALHVLHAVHFIPVAPTPSPQHTALQEQIANQLKRFSLPHTGHVAPLPTSRATANSSTTANSSPTGLQTRKQPDPISP
jgi:hypothetical protein